MTSELSWRQIIARIFRVMGQGLNGLWYRPIQNAEIQKVFYDVIASEL